MGVGALPLNVTTKVCNASDEPLIYHYINSADLCCYIILGDYEAMSNILIWEYKICSKLNLSIIK